MAKTVPQTEDFHSVRLQRIEPGAIFPISVPQDVTCQPAQARVHPGIPRLGQSLVPDCQSIILSEISRELGVSKFIVDRVKKVMAISKADFIRQWSGLGPTKECHHSGMQARCC